MQSKFTERNLQSIQKPGWGGYWLIIVFLGINSFSYCIFLFIQLSTDDLKFVTRVHYLAENAPNPGVWGEHEIDYILIAQKDVDINRNPNEVESCMYVDPEQLQQMIGGYLVIVHIQLIYCINLNSNNLFTICIFTWRLAEFGF